MKSAFLILILSLFSASAFAQVKIKNGDAVVTVDGNGNTLVKTKDAKVVTRQGQTLVTTKKVVVKKADVKKYRKHKKVRCSKNQTIELKGVKITSKVAILAKGNCEITIRDSKIIGFKTAIRAQGNADVKIINSMIIGKKVALKIRDNATVEKKNSTVKGKVVKSDNASYIGETEKNH